MKSFIGAVLFICVAFSANAQLLWKVSGNGLNQPSYIIGTHHLAPFSIMDSIAGLKKAMNETQQVYGEMKMSEMQSPATMEKMQKAMMIESDTTLTSLLSPEDFETANKFCKENLMVDLNMAPKLKPAFLLNSGDGLRKTYREIQPARATRHILSKPSHPKRKKGGRTGNCRIPIQSAFQWQFTTTASTTINVHS